jgi:hypothetical protein
MMNELSEQPISRLIVQKGPQLGHAFDLTALTITIGRSPASDITINDPEISRKHARLARQGGDYAIEDLGSTNGTFVNDRRLAGLTPLHDGDVIEFGDAVKLLYETEPTLPIDLPEASAAVGKTAVSPQPVAAPPPVQPAPPPPAQPSSSWSCRRQVMVGCGFLLLLIFLCTATIFFLDAYQNGRLLYCGPIRPFWDQILGLLGFASPCS